MLLIKRSILASIPSVLAGLISITKVKRLDTPIHTPTTSRPAWYHYTAWSGLTPYRTSLIGCSWPQGRGTDGLLM